MVQLTEVEDESFTNRPEDAEAEVLLGSDNEDDDDFTDTDSEISTDSFENVPEETLAERIYALRDMVPPHYRRSISETVSTISSFAKSTVNFGGNALWILSTSAFFVGVPWALALAEEQQYVQMEREQGMIKGANEMLTPGATSMLTNPEGEKHEEKTA
ncbi:mitochondrial import receptor subunit tom22 [Ascosphaera apis ARSEF 7405]|uniref:Mitochondrial import receptor subunit tom22 n=1 Tax=Ascosphaera apis ARSEF 7405 TaxID=392613 RepID=A0A168AGR3_9EURO|nr:mitochondrial import receptor subunit tom22 [Ascosphaera apis ARSEF 7405]